MAMKLKSTQNRPSGNQRQSGISLIELMISITLGIFLIWGVTQSFLASKQIYRLQEGMARIQENGRLAQEFLSYDIRNAGDYGCASGDNFIVGGGSAAANPYPDDRNDTTNNCGSASTTDSGFGINKITAITALDDEFEFAVYGFNNCTSGAAPCNIGSTTTTLTASAPTSTLTAGATVVTIPNSPTATLSMAVKANTDVLMVHVATDVGVVTGVTGTSSSIVAPPAFTVGISTMTINTSAKFVNTTAEKDRLAVSDCAHIRIFSVSNMTSAGTTLTLPTSENYCTTAALSQNNTTARQILTYYYFVAANSHGGYSLFRQTGGLSGSTAQELLEGVEDLQLTIDIGGTGANNGTDAATANDYIVNCYLPAGDSSGSNANCTNPATATQWAQAWDGWDWYTSTAQSIGHRDYSAIRSVHYSLLLRSEDDSVLKDVQTVSFNGSTLYGGATASSLGDRRIREVFTGTIGIRSRGN